MSLGLVKREHFQKAEAELLSAPEVNKTFNISGPTTWSDPIDDDDARLQ